MRETSLAHQKDQERPTVGRNPAITTWHVWNPVNNGDIHHTNWLAGFLNHQQQDYVKILLEPLSLLVLEGPSRLNFTHAIRQSSLGIDFFQFHAVFSFKRECHGKLKFGVWRYTRPKPRRTLFEAMTLKISSFQVGVQHIWGKLWCEVLHDDHTFVYQVRKLEVGIIMSYDSIFTTC